MATWPDRAEVIVCGRSRRSWLGLPALGNVQLTTAGATAGIRRGLAGLLGQVTGMGATLFAITLGLGSLLLAHPLALQVLK